MFMSKTKKTTGFLFVIMALFSENEIFARIRSELEGIIAKEAIISAIGLFAFNYIQNFFKKKRSRRSNSRRRRK